MIPTITSAKMRVPVEPLRREAFEPFGIVIDNPNPATARHSSASSGALANQGTAIKYAHVTELTNFYDELAPSRIKARPSVSRFHCHPRYLRETNDKWFPVQDVPILEDCRASAWMKHAKQAGLFDVTTLERHPFTSQTFVPIGCHASDPNQTYLVIVAPTIQSDQEQSITDAAARRPRGGGPPDLLNLKAFLARGNQAVTYAAGTWHAPMAVIGEHPIDFLVWQYANNVPEEDCQEIQLQPQGADLEGTAIVVPPGKERLTILNASSTSVTAKL